jgi:hypothetical protein
MTTEKDLRCAHAVCSCVITSGKYCSTECEAMEKPSGRLGRQDLAVRISQYTSERCTESRRRVRCARQRSKSEIRDSSGTNTETKLIMASLFLITSVGTLAGASKTMQQEDLDHLQHPVNDVATSSEGEECDVFVG